MRRLFALFFLSSFSCISIAQTVEVSVLIDRGGSGGCTVTAVDSISGVDARLTASVDSATTQVDALTLEHCVGGSFGAAQTLASGYPVGLNNGESGADVVELSLAAAQLGVGSTQFVFTMMADDGSSVDQAAGGMAGTSFPVPLAPWALLLLAIMVVIMGFWALRRHRGPTALLLGMLAVSAWAAHFMLDGEVADWTGVSPISDPAGDPTNGGNRADILAGFSAEENGQLWFRVDLADIENASPTAADDALSIDEDTLLSGENVLADNGAGADSDPDGDPLTVTAFDVLSTQGAAVTIAANGDLDYDPTGASALQGLAVGESVDDTFTYTIEDPDGSSDTATVTVTVAGVNDPPAASDDAFATDKNTPVTTTSVLTNDTDPDASDSLSVDSIDTTTTVGVVTDNGDGTFDYDPDGQFDGLGEGDSDTDSFIYTVTDGHGGTDTATVTITITGANTAPVATDDAFATDEDSALTTGDVLANDTDTEGDPLSIDSVDITGTVGLVTDNGDGTFDYDPNGQFEALAQGDSDTDSFVYTVTDGNGGTDSATVTITINGLNDAPTAGNDAYATDEDVELVVPAPGVLTNDNDVDSGDTLTAVLDSDVTDGTLTLNADGSFSYTPDPDFNGTDAFTYHATDGTADSVIATVTITINSINDPPTANDDAFTVDEDTTDNVFDVLANDTDAPDTGETLTITAVGAPSQGGTATTGGTDITYTPAPDFSGIEIFTYTIDDGNGGADPATVTVTVSGVDDPPTAVDDTATLTEDDPATIINVLANDTDVDGGPIGITSVTQPANGMVVNNGTDLSYAPNPNYCNDGSPTDDFTYTLNGGSTATVAVAVTCVNDPPLADDEIISAACNIESVVETDPGQSAAATGAVFRTVADNVLDGDSDPVEGTAVAIVQADGQTSDTTAPFQITTNEGGSLTLHADGSFTYTPEAGDRSVADTFTYTIEDADGGQDSATVTLNVGGTCVWFVDNSAGADDTGTGTSSDPFTSLVDELGPDALPDDAEDASIAGDVIYVFEGNSTSGDPYDGNFSAEAGERLLGQGVDLVMDFGSGPETLFTGNVANRPLVVGVSGGVAVNVIDVTGVEVAGLELAGGDHAVSVFGNTAAFGLDLHFNEMSGSSNESIVVNQFGNFDSTLAITANAVTAATGDSLNVEVSDGTLALAIDGNALTSMANGIDLDGSGALLHVTSFCGNTLSGDIGGIGVVARDVIFDADPSDADFTGDQVGCIGITTSIGSAVNPVAFAMLLEDVAGDLAFGTLDLYSEGVGQVGLEVTGTGALNAAAGTGFAITSTGGTVDSANGPALTLYDSTLGLTLTGGVTSNNSPSHGVLLNAVTGTLSVTSGTTVTGSAGLGIDATASPGVAVDFGATSLSGSGSGIRLASSPGADFTFASLDVTTSGGVGLSANNAGTVNIESTSSTINAMGGAAVEIINTAGQTNGSSGWTFTSLESDASPTRGLLLDGLTDDFVVSNVTRVDDPDQIAVEVRNSPGRSISFGSTIALDNSVGAGATANGIDLATNNAGATFNFRVLTLVTDAGFGLRAGASTVSFTNAGSFIAANGGPGLDLNGTMISGTGASSFNEVTSVDSPGEGISLVGVGGQLTIGSGFVQNSAGTSVHVNGGAPLFAYFGQVTQPNAAFAVEVENTTGGLVTLPGQVTGTAAALGVRLVSNAGDVSFNGLDLGTAGTPLGSTGVTLLGGSTGTSTFTDMAVFTTGATGFNADNGGVVQATGGGNRITTTNGTAIRMVGGTTIGAGGMGLRRVDVDGLGTSTAPAIHLANTGAGFFSILGDGTASLHGNGSGGTIQDLVDTDAIILDNTGGRVTLQNMVIEDIAGSNDATDARGTRSFRDGIHGENVNGGLTLQSTTMRRFSDHAILGALFSDSTSLTSWTGLEIHDSLIELSNRFHVPERGDDQDEGMIRIRGLTGTMIVDNSTLRQGGRGLDITTPNGTGILDVTIQRSNFEDLYKEFIGGSPVNVGGRGVSFEARGDHDMVVRIGDPDEIDPALGNTFTNNMTASVVIFGQEGGSDPHTGDVDAVISRNTFLVTDHSTAQLTPPTFVDFNFPQGGVSLNPAGSGTFEAIVSNNLFDEVMHAAGGFGQLTIGHNTGGGASEFIVTGNEFRRPWDQPLVLRAEGNASMAILVENNTWTEGLVGGAGTNFEGVNCGTGDPAGFCPAPFAGFRADVRNGGAMDLTVRGEVLPQHDDVNNPGFTFIAEVQAQAGNVLNLYLDDNKAPAGYRLIRSAGTFNLYRENGGDTTPLAILDGNGNTGGNGTVAGGDVDGDNTDPPVVAADAGITPTDTLPTLPAIVIP